MNNVKRKNEWRFEIIIWFGLVVLVSNGYSKGYQKGKRNMMKMYIFNKSGYF